MNAQAIKGVYYQKLTVKGASDAELNDEGTAAQADGDETTEVLTGKTFYFNPHFAKSVEAADQARIIFQLFISAHLDSFIT